MLSLMLTETLSASRILPAHSHMQKVLSPAFLAFTQGTGKGVEIEGVGIGVEIGA